MDTGHLYTCKMCGKIVDAENMFLRSNELKELLVEELCHDCHYWKGVFSTTEEHCVIEGHFITYKRTSNRSRNSAVILTYGKECFLIESYVDYGEIPEKYRKDYPDDANFVNYNVYKRVVFMNGFDCRRKGCWDRIRCLWYRTGEMDWNPIPVNHKIGEEMCPLFIDVQNIRKCYIKPKKLKLIKN